MEDKTPSTGRTLFTFGHSNHALETFLDLVGQHQIEVVADVRSSPYSGYASQFNKEVIQNHLRTAGIRYVFLGDVLGGRPEGDDFYDEKEHVLYARVAESPRFQEGIDRLLDDVRAHRVTLLCGEEDPIGCHRRVLIGRVLCQRGLTVLHIRGDGRIQSEEELAKEEAFRKTKGQMTLFDLEEEEEWRSTQSVSPEKQQPNSSKLSDGSGLNV